MNSSVISDILVFKTSIDSEHDLERIARVLDRDQRIRKWNVDLEDIDHILRIESREHDPAFIIQLISHEGFFCEELPD
jgi:hypothetical protein